MSNCSSRITCLAAQELLKQFHVSSQVFQAAIHFLTAAMIHIQIQDTNIIAENITTFHQDA